MQTHQARIILCQHPSEYEVIVDTDTEIFRKNEETIGIDEIRSLVTEAHIRPQQQFTAKSIVLAGAKITSEAQQAALKILEEPPKDVLISIVLPTGTYLLATVLSRVQVEIADYDVKDSVLKSWIQKSYAERIMEVDERIKAKDTMWLQQFKIDLLNFGKSNPNFSAFELREIQIVIDNFLTRGSSNKMLLEHLALSLPFTHK